jgi:prephenate dehydrogenase
MPLVERMTIAGVGLIGGSLAAAARRAGLVGEVLGFGRTAANLAVAHERGLIDRIVTDDVAAADADLIVLATPVETCARLAERFRRHARPGTVVTDVGSVKGTLVAALERVWGDGSGGVVGAHPIAGSEASGAAAAQADLFRERLCILTPTARTPAPALRLVRSLWEGVGARIEEMSPETHDAILARVSHLPHVLAYALVRAVTDRQADGHRLLDYVGTGFLDVTRIAASPAEVWRDIVLANRPALTAALAEMRLALDELVTLINAGDARALEEALATAADVRRGLGAKG